MAPLLMSPSLGETGAENMDDLDFDPRDDAALELLAEQEAETKGVHLDDEWAKEHTRRVLDRRWANRPWGV